MKHVTIFVLLAVLAWQGTWVLARPTTEDPYQLARLGRFDEAEARLREAPPTAESRSHLPSLLMEAGRVEEALAESGRLLRDHPDDPNLISVHARGLLFRQALQPRPEELPEIRRLLAVLARTPVVGSPGLEAQSAWVEGDLETARRKVERALESPYTIYPEVLDLKGMKVALALRAGRREEAARGLEDLLQAGRAPRDGAYYELHPVWEGALWVRHAFLGGSFEPREARAAVETYLRLGHLGVVPKFPAEEVYRFRDRYAEALAAGDRATLLAETGRFFEVFPPERQPTCFYGEAVHLPLVRVATALRAGDLAADLGDGAAAARWYREGLALHPENRILRERLRLK